MGRYLIHGRGPSYIEYLRKTIFQMIHLHGETFLFPPTVYKVLMKYLLARILPWLVDTIGTLSPKQKAYIDRQGMNEHVFCLKTGIDDFKHESCKFYTVFLDFRDAFGTLSHNMMLRTLEEIYLNPLWTSSQTCTRDLFCKSSVETSSQSLYPSR